MNVTIVPRITLVALGAEHPRGSDSRVIVADDVPHPSEQHHRRSVIEQRLALDERAQVLKGREGEGKEIHSYQ